LKRNHFLVIALIILTGFLINLCYRIYNRQTVIVIQKNKTIDSLRLMLNETNIVLGTNLYTANCQMCHPSKRHSHYLFKGIVERLGVPYLKLYITKQDSLLAISDKYAKAVKEEYGNMGNSHNFKFSEFELEALIAYMK